MKSSQVRPLELLQAAINAVCSANERTNGRVFGEAIVGYEYVLVALRRRPIILEGVCEDVARPSGEVDILDLMAEHSAANQ